MTHLPTVINGEFKLAHSREQRKTVPTPVGHFLAGGILAETQKQRDWKLYSAILLFAFLPDFDFLFGFVVGDPNRWHHGFTHSFVFVTLAGLFGGWIFYRFRKKNYRFYSAILTSAGISHLILDVLALDLSEPLGCPLLWPFTKKYFIAPFTVFSDVSRISDSRIFFASLLNQHNLRTVLIEIAVLMPILIIVMMRKKWLQREREN